MNGNLNIGPAMEPFCLMYMTGDRSAAVKESQWDMVTYTDHRLSEGSGVRQRIAS